MMSLLKKVCRKTSYCDCYGVAKVNGVTEIHYCNGNIAKVNYTVIDLSRFITC